MPYTSPISLLPPGISDFSHSNLTIAKHKLMAEFELQGSVTIVVKGREMSRNDVLNLFDELESAKDIEYHLLVADSPELLHFLERRLIPIGGEIKIPAAKLTTAFLNWLSPFFLDSYKASVKIAFRKQQVADFRWLVAQSGKWMTAGDQGKAWTAIKSELEWRIGELAQINNSKKGVLAEIAPFVSDALVQIVNMLPSDQFIDLASRYAAELLRYSIYEFNNSYKTRAFKILNYALGLKVNDETRVLLLKTEREMNELLLERYERPESRKTSAGDRHFAARRVFIVSSWIFLALIILAVFRKQTTRDRNQFDINEYFKHYNPALLQPDSPIHDLNYYKNYLDSISNSSHKSPDSAK